MTYRREVPVLLLAVLILLAAAKTPALAQAPIPTFPPFLQTLPGLSPPQASVAKAIDTLCPNLVRLEPTRQLNTAQQDLLDQCRFMRNGSLGTSVLPDVLRDVTSEQTAAQGTSAIETSTQLRLVGPRLSALRLGATGIALNGLKLDFDGTTVAADQSIGALKDEAAGQAPTRIWPAGSARS